jgi:hypothetical protein
VTGPAHGSDDLGAELRALALVALDRLDPVLARFRDDAARATAGGAPAHGATCTSCPICAALAAVRGERPEVAGRLAEQAAGLLGSLREALAAGAEPETPRPPARRAARTVQHIPVDREPSGGEPC